MRKFLISIPVFAVTFILTSFLLGSFGMATGLGAPVDSLIPEVSECSGFDCACPAAAPQPISPTGFPIRSNYADSCGLEAFSYNATMANVLIYLTIATVLTFVAVRHIETPHKLKQKQANDKH